MASGSAIGIMDPAFFVGKKKLLEFLNGTFACQLTSIEDTHNGALACQIVDAVYGDVPMHKVRFDAVSEYEKLSNYKLLQQSFERHAVDKFIDVAKLLRGKPQDNLENMQWFKNFYDVNCPKDVVYDPIARRSKSKGANLAAYRGKGVAEPVSTTVTSKPKAEPKVLEVEDTKPAAVEKNVSSASTSKVVEVKESKMDEMARTISEISRERDFYFGKLREIEILLVSTAAATVSSEAILNILYKTDDDFVAPSQSQSE
jgi:microtubule-associated protein, RP/EB family